MKHSQPGYGESTVVAIIESREKKYEFRDTPQAHREKWMKDNGILKHVKLKRLDTEVYVTS